LRKLHNEELHNLYSSPYCSYNWSEEVKEDETEREQECIQGFGMKARGKQTIGKTKM
jgi:hypothetical protein